MRKMLVPALAALLCCGAALAEEPAKAEKPASALESTLIWFRHLREGLADTAVKHQYQHRSAAAVAAVRGPEQDSVDPDKPEWKLKSKSDKAAIKKERAELASAVDLVIAGKYDEGRSALDAFEKAHPQSKLLPDVAEARENIKALEGARVAQTPKAAEPAKP